MGAFILIWLACYLSNGLSEFWKVLLAVSVTLQSFYHYITVFNLIRPSLTFFLLLKALVTKQGLEWRISPKVVSQLCWISPIVISQLSI